MVNEMRDRLRGLLLKCGVNINTTSIADHLIENGVTIIPCESFKNKADFVKIPCKCKECEHFNNYNPDRTYCEEHSDGWGDYIVYVDEDDYCSFGIRKEGAEE